MIVSGEYFDKDSSSPRRLHTELTDFNSNFPVVLDVTIFASHPLLDLFKELGIDESIDISSYSFSGKQPLNKERNRILSQISCDFESFMDMAESICEDNFKLQGEYKVCSSENHLYYHYLAKNDLGETIIDFRLRMYLSMYTSNILCNKINIPEDLSQELFDKLFVERKIKVFQFSNVVVHINDETCDDYIDASDYIWATVRCAVESMNSKRK